MSRPNGRLHHPNSSINQNINSTSSPAHHHHHHYQQPTTNNIAYPPTSTSPFPPASSPPYPPTNGGGHSTIAPQHYLHNTTQQSDDLEPSCLVRTPSGNVFIPSGESTIIYANCISYWKHISLFIIYVLALCSSHCYIINYVISNINFLQFVYILSYSIIAIISAVINVMIKSCLRIKYLVWRP